MTISMMKYHNDICLAWSDTKNELFITVYPYGWLFTAPANGRKGCCMALYQMLYIIIIHLFIIDAL